MSGYTSITLGELLEKVDELTKQMGNDNRSGTIRMIVKKYFDLKERDIDLLHLEIDDIVERLK
jgi:metal-responsive CopG/Arc/MetJ family transcriptional regulator